MPPHDSQAIERVRVEPLRLAFNIPLIASLAALWVGGEYVRVRRRPRRFLEWRAALALNRIDRWARDALRVKNTRAADLISDALAYGVMPAAVLTNLVRSGPGWMDRLPGDVIAIGRAVTLAGALNQLVKGVAPRERPAARAVPKWRKVPDRMGSFFSGHTATSSLLATATALRGLSRGVPVGTVLSLPALALLTGYLRIAADKHYLSDVVAGAGFGAAAAWLLARPWPTPFPGLSKV